MRSNILFVFLLIIFACDSDTSVDVPTGQGGSMSRFAVKGDYLYIATKESIEVYSIQEGKFEKRKSEYVGFGIETISAQGNFLYLGAQDAMYIYAITVPSSPEFIFRYTHVTSCDPVVVQGNRAYVTLSSGSACNRGVNALEILDISNPYNPLLIKNYPMSRPLGLSVEGNLLFLCEAHAGFKIFDITEETDIQLLKEFNDLHAYDVIARNGLAIVTGETGIFQYSYDSENNFNLISKIDVTRN